MGVSMMCRVRAQYAFALAAAASAAVVSLPAIAADLPQIKQSKANAVPSCATPGRLMSFLDARNSKLDPKFATIAADYMRVGDDLQIRWDTAFFQMLLETGNLAFTGDVSAAQNNFAGLGATGKKEPGETFPDVATGVKAHLEHLLMYAGEKLDNPVAERTRKVQEWGVLTSWQTTIDGPMTYTHLAKKWAPGSRGYSRDIGEISEAFYNGLCTKPDPKPEMLALAKPGIPDKATAKFTTANVTDAAAGETEAATPKVSGADLARRAVEEARASGSFVRSSLGGGSLLGLTDAAKPATPAATEAAAAAAPAIKILNAAKPEADDAADVSAAPATAAVAPPASTPEPAAKVQTAALGTGLKSAATPPPAVKDGARADVPGSACKVWTASYGGARAVIIKANADSQDNYTVLDVNEGTEMREADAYIAAYAKGGKTVGEFISTSQALDKAFELCPEG